MKVKIVTTLVTFVLVILPFLLGIWIGKYSPYADPNNFQTYVIIWAIISVATVSILFLLAKFYFQSFDKEVLAGALLFLLVCPIVGIIGLAAPPDLSIKMLEHPEHEHLRYIFLFIAAILFGGFSFLLLSCHSFKLKPSTRWIIALVFLLAFAEFIWEFNHHYAYPEALKDWINQGKDAEAFGKDYDNVSIITIGVIGRYLQFLAVIWLSLHLFKLKRINIWSPILCIPFSLLGVFTATLVYITQANLPKGIEFMFLFFIPGIPFLLMYWIGVGILTKYSKSAVAIQH